jgi:hypothetical protein
MSEELTHPVIASLDHPLFAFGGKRGLNAFILTVFLSNEGSIQQHVYRIIDASLCSA